MHSCSRRKEHRIHLYAYVHTRMHAAVPSCLGWFWLRRLAIAVDLLVLHSLLPTCASLAASCWEQEYYTSDWNAKEQAQGMHLAVMKFANESKSQRGMKRLAQDRQAAPTGAKGPDAA